MIGRLTGRLAAKTPDQVLLDVSGVGYLVHIPLSTFYELPEQESPASLWIHTHVREDALALYGFLTERERSLFLLLLGVAGIGPRVALTVLSGIPPAELVDALRTQDVRRLVAVPGVGKKTAERMVLELAEKAGRIAGEAPGKAPGGRRRRRRHLRPRQSRIPQGRSRARRGRHRPHGRADGLRRLPEGSAAPHDRGLRPETGSRTLPRQPDPGPRDPRRHRARRRRRRRAEAAPADRSPSTSARRRSARTSRSSSPRRGAAGEPLDHVLLTGPPGPRQDDPRAHRRAGDGRRPAPDRRADDRAGGRPRRAPDQPPAQGRPLRRRDPPPLAGGRGDPLPGHGGLPARRPDRRGPDGAHGEGRPAAFHPDRRHDASGPALAAAPRPLRHRPAPGFLRRRRPRRGSSSVPRAFSRSRSRRRLPREIGSRSRGTPAHRQPAAAPAARLRRGRRQEGDRPRHRAGRRSRGSRSTSTASTSSTAGSSSTIIEKFGGGPVGVGAIAASLGEDRGTLEDLYEPYLLQAGFLQRTPRGRVASPAAYRHLGITAPRRDGELF